MCHYKYTSITSVEYTQKYMQIQIQERIQNGNDYPVIDEWHAVACLFCIRELYKKKNEIIQNTYRKMHQQ